MAKYYKYHVPESFLTILVGNDKQQIIDTIKHYAEKEQLRIPEESYIGELGSLEIQCGLPFMSEKYSFTAKINDNLSLYINANAVNYVQGLGLGYKLQKRGSLYKFEPGITSFGLYFLPEDLMIAIRDYDWAKHKDIIQKWENIYDNMDFGKNIVTARDIKKDPNNNN